MILRDRCSTSYDLASLFRGRRSSLDRWTFDWYEAVSSALNFPFLKEVSQNCLFLICQIQNLKSLAELHASFWMSSSKLEEVSLNCCVFDVVKFKTEDVSQNCFVFDVVKFKN